VEAEEGWWRYELADMGSSVLDPYETAERKRRSSKVKEIDR
jgi:hypothetical protein